MAMTEEADSTHHQPLTETNVKLNEVVVTGLTGQQKLVTSASPISVVSPKQLESQPSTNIIDAISRQPGVSQITTGSGISKPVIRGMGYNRVVVVNDGIRQEGQQWGDEHGVEIDAASVHSVEILKGPASLMYGSDALAGVIVFNSAPVLPMGEMRANVMSGYQSNNGLFDYSLNFAGNKQGFVWNTRYSGKMAHAYKIGMTDMYMAQPIANSRSRRCLDGIIMAGTLILRSIIIILRQALLRANEMWRRAILQCPMVSIPRVMVVLCLFSKSTTTRQYSTICGM